MSLLRKIPIQNLIDLNTFLILQGVPPRAYSRKGKKDPGLKSGESGARAPYYSILYPILDNTI